MITIKNLRTGTPANPWGVRVDRQNGILGNPFFMKDESQRDAVCDKYAKWLDENAKLDNSPVKQELDRLLNIYKTYGRIDLWCWCAPKRCHAEKIREYILTRVS